MNIGEIYMYGGSVAPSGFLLCDGTAISRSTYSDLFSVVGTTFGQGDGSTTFNLPDISGRVIIGSSNDYAIGDTGGEEDHILLTNELPVHSHSIPSHGHANTITVTTPKLTHSITQPAYTYTSPSGTANRYSSQGMKKGFSGATATNATRSANLAISNHAASNCTKTGSVTDCDAFDTSSTGTGAAHNNMQPYITINHIIYTGVV